MFGWVSLQPDEDTFTFEWLDRVLDKLHAGGVHACLATATASVPAWLDQKYPDVLQVGADGRKKKHGDRHVFCPNSANFRRLSTGLARRMAERYKDHPALLIWHVSNEYGNPCYCDQCAAAFREWLARPLRQPGGSQRPLVHDVLGPHLHGLVADRDADPQRRALHAGPAD